METETGLARRRFLAGGLGMLPALQPQRVLGANDRIRIGIIGCGDRGRNALMKEIIQFAGETNAEITAICDTCRQQREQATAMVKQTFQREPRQFVHYQELLALSDVDAVTIATPDHQHATMLIAAARAGKDIYIEKPIAMTMKELVRAVDEVKKRARVVQCGTQVRSFANSAAARQFVSSGQLGKIFKVEQSRNSFKPYWHGFGERQVTESDVDWRAFLMHRPYRAFNADQYTAWYGYHEFSRGPHTNLMVHFIDLVHFITGAKLPRRVMTLGGTYRWKDSRTAPDSVETVLEYPDEGMLVRYCSVFGTNANSYMRFFGTRGVLDTSNWWGEFKASGEGIREGDRIEKEMVLDPIPSTPHMKNWLECLRTRQQPNASIDAGYAQTVAVIMADESYVRGKVVGYDPARRVLRA